MITGRITGLRWVTSKKYRFSTRRMFCCKADGSVMPAAEDFREGSDHPLPGLLEDVAGGLVVDEPAVDDVGAADELAGLRVDRDDDHHDAVARRACAGRAATSPHVADARGRRRTSSRAGPARPCGPARRARPCRRPRRPGCGRAGCRPRSASRAWCARCRRSPWHRDEPTRPHEVQHELQLLGRRVPETCTGRDRHVEHVGAGPIQRRRPRGGSPVSLPGITEEDRITVSPSAGASPTCARARPSARAPTAARPAIPVQITTTRPRVQARRAPRSATTSRSSGTSR